MTALHTVANTGKPHTANPALWCQDKHWAVPPQQHQGGTGDSSATVQDHRVETQPSGMSPLPEAAVLGIGVPGGTGTMGGRLGEHRFTLTGPFGCSALWAL